MKSFKKIYQSNTRKMDKNFACNIFDFISRQFTRDIVFQKSRHVKALQSLKMTRVALILPRVDEIGTSHWGKLE